MTLLRMYALTAIVLSLKMAAISVVQGSTRAKSGIFVNPEDARTFGVKEAPAEAPMVDRAAKAWRNDLENIPIFLILAWIYVSAGLSAAAFVVYCIIYMLARIAHTVCYLKGLQPYRTISFTIGTIVMLVIIIQLFIGVVLA